MSTLLTSTLHEIVGRMDRHADTILKDKYGISFNWLHLMAVLRSVEPTTQHNLATCLNYSDAAVSKLLGRMTGSEYLIVTDDPTHQRKKVVQLTEKGKKITDEALLLLETEFKSILSTAPVDLAVYSDMSDQINQILKRGGGNEKS